MQLPRWAKYLSGVLTIWGTLYILFFLGFILYAFILSITHHKIPISHESGAAVMLAIAALHLLTILSQLALLAFYIVHIVKNKDMKESSKIAWLLVIFFFGFFAMPVYWYLNIWRGPGPPAIAPVTEGQSAL